jgi:2-polyprenyl-6-methoxyphenol hydroxylase-like FAD-dependent oxidoreductase
MAERVLVIGAGLAGLSVALALAPTGRQVILLDRDPPPPSAAADEAFRDWTRRGVGHLRHSHAFLARLRTIIRDEHPGLLADLLAAGCRELTFDRWLTDLHKPTYVQQPIDADLVVLTSRRTTLELVIRAYVERLPGVTLRSDAFVTGPITEPGPPIRVTGVTLQGGETLQADLVVDAGGRAGGIIEQLMELGAPIAETSETAGILYYTRHYRLHPGLDEPPRGAAPSTGDMGFLKFGVFPADNGCFSITLCVPEIEEELRKAVVDPEKFDAICNEIPGLVPWIAPDRSTATSKVFGMGELHSRWRDLVKDAQPAVLGLFGVGDAIARTNPLYGRGCSFAMVGAYLLKDALRTSPDPAQRLLAYDAAVRRELLPYYTTMLDQDRAAIRRARQTLTPGYRPSLRSRATRGFLEDGVNIAIRSDPELLRAALLGFHMLEHPSAWLKRPANLAKVMRYWARGKQANRAAYPPKPGPDREPLMTAVGLDPQLDIQRLAAAG